ncbi:MAG: hypothetical protein GEU78_07780 [Actinobacteria bacterium]|nr:hypothetical protein [Actinomycetota bacterium]MQB00178.1 hypothetical protein [Actinomycetota bacterium]
MSRALDLALALIISRVVQPTSKLPTLTWWANTTLGVDLGVADASTDEIYAGRVAGRNFPSRPPQSEVGRWRGARGSGPFPSSSSRTVRDMK